jgi:hypothetical protein
LEAVLVEGMAFLFRRVVDLMLEMLFQVQGGGCPGAGKVVRDLGGGGLLPCERILKNRIYMHINTTLMPRISVFKLSMRLDMLLKCCPPTFT